MIPGKLEFFVEDRFFAVHIGDLVSIDDPVCEKIYKGFDISAVDHALSSNSIDFRCKENFAPGMFHSDRTAG